MAKGEMLSAYKAVKVKNTVLKFINVNKSELLITAFGFVISRIKLVFSMSPFGCAYFAAAYKGNFAFGVMLYFAVLLGNLSGVTEFPVKYIFSNFIFIIVATLFKDKLLNNEKITALFIGFSLFFCGIFYVALNGFLFFDFAMLFFECFLAYTACLIFKKVLPVFYLMKPRRVLDKDELICFFAACALVVMGVCDVPLPFGMDPRQILAIYVILFCSGVTNAGLTSVCSIIFGIVMSIGADSEPEFMTVFCTGALFASYFSKYGKIASAMAYAAANAVASMYFTGNGEAVISYLHIAAAGILLVITPKSLFVYADNFVQTNLTDKKYSQKTKNIIMNRLSAVSDAFFELSGSFQRMVRAEKERAEVYEIFNSAARKVCRSCPMKHNCYEREYEKTSEAVNKMCKIVEEKGKIEISDVPLGFAKRCGKIADFVDACNSLYEVYRINKGWQSRLYNMREIIINQFAEFSAIVKQVKQEISEDVIFNADAERQLETFLDRAGISFFDVTVTEKNNTRVELVLKECETYGFCSEFVLPVVSRALGKPFEMSEKKCDTQKCSVKFVSQSKFKVETGTYSIKKDGEKYSGDSFLFIESGGAEFSAILSDGMGSGISAKSNSESAVKTFKNLTESGFMKKTAVKTINSVMVLKSAEESFATIDIVTIDLQSAMANFLKTGAVSTYIKRKSSVDKITSTSLPAGILSNVDIEESKAELNDGDYIIMITDGVLENSATDLWLCDFIASIQDKTAEEIPQIIAEAAVAKNGGHASDDITVLTIKICKTEE